MCVKFAALLVASAMATLSTHAALFDSGFLHDGAVPDGNLTGWSDTRTISGLGSQITDVSVRLQFSSEHNGDLYAYLTHGGTMVPLLNRVGTGTGAQPTYSFGFATDGMNVWLRDSGGPNIHDVQSPLSGGVYSPDGRAVSPLSSASTVYGSTPIGFSAFDGMDPNGSWTLFFADVSGGSQTRIEAWELEITAVPEPVNVALGVFGGVVGIAYGWRKLRARRESLQAE